MSFTKFGTRPWRVLNGRLGEIVALLTLRRAQIAGVDAIALIMITVVDELFLSVFR